MEIESGAEMEKILERSGDLLQVAHSWPKTLVELTDVLCAHFKQIGMAPPAAKDFSQKVIIVIAHHLGGRMFYLPRDRKLRLALRDDAIWREFDGANVHELAQRYELTTNRVYQILAEQRALRRTHAP